MLALLEETRERVTACLDDYDAQGAGQAIERFVDQLSNWYLRRNRRRFWKAAAGEDKQAAYLTLYECLDAVNRMMAPLMPFLAEEVYQNLVLGVNPDAPPTVHLAGWPSGHPARRNPELLEALEAVQQVVVLGRAARNDSKIRVRQPLPRILVRVPDARAGVAIQTHQDQILEELNVKALELIPRDADLVEYRIKPNLPRVGRRYGKLIPAIRAALAKADGRVIAKAVAAGETVALDAGGQILELEPEDFLVETTSAEGYACAEEGGYLVALDTRLDEALLREGLARELIRTVQEARKQAGLEVSDRIALRVVGNEPVRDALAAWRELLMSETLAEQWVDEGESGFTPRYRSEHSLGDANWSIELAKVERAAA